jgi:AcrR family transcriptional regulator
VAKKKTDSAASLRDVGATSHRIIKCSIELFNRKGLRNVAIERIAAGLKISPGNLTYHFPRKQQLIAATLEFMKLELRTALEPPTGVRTARDGADYLIRLYRTLWDYRFFFNALTYVLTDRHLRREYSDFKAWAMETMRRDLEVLREHGHFVQPVAPNTFVLLAENMWALWLNWLRLQQIETPLAKTPDDAAIYDCALHNWSLCQPWMDAAYAAELLQVFNELLNTRKAVSKRLGG